MRMLCAALLCSVHAFGQAQGPVRIHAIVRDAPGGANVYRGNAHETYWVGADAVALRFARVLSGVVVEIDQARCGAFRNLMLRVAQDESLSGTKIARASAVASLLAGAQVPVELKTESVLEEYNDVMSEKKCVPRFVVSWDLLTGFVDWKLARPAGLWARDNQLGNLWRGAIYIRHFPWSDAARRRAFISAVDGSPEWRAWRKFIIVDERLWARGQAMVDQNGGKTLYPLRKHVDKPGRWLHELSLSGLTPGDADVYVAMDKWLHDPSDEVAGSFLGLMKESMRSLIQDSSGIEFASDEAKRAAVRQRWRVVLHSWCSMYQAALLTFHGPITGKRPTAEKRLFVEPCAAYYASVRKALIQLRECRDELLGTRRHVDSIAGLIRLCELLAEACKVNGVALLRGKQVDAILGHLSGDLDDPTAGMACAIGPVSVTKLRSRRATLEVEHAGVAYKAHGMHVDVRIAR